MKKADKAQYLKQNALAALSILRDIQERESAILISHERGQFISRILFVDLEQVILDFGSDPYENKLAQEMSVFRVSADVKGAKAECTLMSPQTIQYDGLSAFSAPLPDRVELIQRRAYFRVCTPTTAPFQCQLNCKDGSSVTLHLHDLSLGGMGMLSNGKLPESLQAGDILENIHLDMGAFGSMTVDVQLLHIGIHTWINNKNETVKSPRLNLQFIALTPGQERQLQQVIYTLEHEEKEKNQRFKEE